MNLDLAKIVAAVNGRLVPHGGPVAVNGVTTDSRQVVAGNLFVALKGPNFDGHDFVATAAADGAVAALCEHAVSGVAIPQVVVEDSLRGLGDLASVWRQRFSLPVAAITGSSGKTTTKEMLAAMLSNRSPGLKTEGNLNNLIGLPLTLFRLADEHRWAVLEMGMSERGEIARLTEIARPGVGIITNVAPAHLATLRSLDGIARAKGELFAALPAGGTAVVNGDDEKVSSIPVANGVKRLIFGTTRDAEVRAEAIAAEGASVIFTLKSPAGERRIRLAMPGRRRECACRYGSRTGPPVRS